jgi:hypothetical protein
MTARGGTQHPPRKVYDIPSPGGPTHLQNCTTWCQESTELQRESGEIRKFT